VFIEVGYPDADLAEITRRAGADPGDIDRLFESKAALLVEAAGRVGQEFFAGVLRRLDEVTPSLVMTAIVVELQAGPVTPMYQLWAETLVLSLRDDDIRRHLDPHLRYAQSALEVVVRAAKDDGLIHQSIDVAATAHACITLMFGSCVMNALGLPQPTVEASAGVLSKFVDGLGFPTRSQVLVDLTDLLGSDLAGEAEVIEISQASGRRPPRGSTPGAS
jgi:AcrR family transcriptional regulator